MIFNFWWSSELLMKSASSDLASDEVLLMTSASDVLHNHFSSEPLFFRRFKLPSCWFHCCHLLFLHTWTNISISNWQFLIPCYHQNLKGNVKHILFQHIVVHPCSSSRRATSTVLDKVRLHQGHPLSTPWIWCSLNLRILELPVHSFDLLTRVFNARSGKRTPFDFKNS